MDNKLILKPVDELEEDFMDINKNLFQIYGYFLEDIMIGYLLIKKDSSNIDNIYIKIFDRYESNGYGNLLFIEGLNLLKEKDIKDIELNIDKCNYKMINIILKNRGIEVTNIKGIEKFIIRL